MKLRITPKSRQCAATMLTVLIICTLLMISVVSYLVVIAQQNRLSARSQSWNMAITIAEAGVEEALQHMNSNGGNLGADGWEGSGNSYSIERTLPSGDKYRVTITNANSASPVIEARAFIYPSGGFAQNQPSHFFAASGVTTQPEVITRAVRVTTSRGNLFLAAMVAKDKIDLKGNGILTDSFDSSDPTKSTNGRYDPAKAGDRGDVASNGGFENVVSVQNANIWGRVHTGIGGTVSIGSQGKVGSVAWQKSSNKGLEPGWWSEDANFTFPDTTPPYSSGLSLPGGGYVGTIIGYSTNSTVVNNTPDYPTTAPSGYFIGPISTNTSTVTVTTYPGPQTGMTTNFSYITVATYPGAHPGLVTNFTAFTTVTSYPGAQPGMSTNTTANHKTKTEPAAGTYVPGTLSYKKPWYTYTKINSYTYASSFSYTYQTYTYSYPTRTYSYSLYQNTANWVTNYYDHILTSGDYSASSLSGSVYVGGKARLVLANGLNMSGNDSFVIGSSGSIEVYAGGSSVTIGGNGIINPSGYAGNFILYCSPSVTDFTLNGNGEFTGVLVAPGASIDMNGGGNSDQDFIGALMVKSVRMNGHFKFHYDEALGRMPANGRLLITSWDEIP